LAEPFISINKKTKLNQYPLHRGLSSLIMAAIQNRFHLSNYILL